MTLDDPLVPLSEAARRLGVDPDTLKRRIVRGELCAVRVLGRWRIPESVVRSFVEEHDGGKAEETNA